MSKYRNFILGDPIIDYLNLKGNTLGYFKDSELKGFNKNFSLPSYIQNVKDQFINKITQKIQKDIIYSTNKDSFLIKTKDLSKYFTNSNKFTGDNYSLFTIEFSSISVNKKGHTLNSGSQKYYNFKNWLSKNEYSKMGYIVDFSFVLGRRYKNSSSELSDSYNYLALNNETYTDLLKDCEHHFKNLENYKIGVDIFPNMKNKNDFPWHNAKKVIANDIKEITLLSGCSNNIRNQMIDSGIYNYEKLTHPLIMNNEPLINNLQLPLPTGENILFVDFEVITSIFEDFSKFPVSNKKSYIFNIGAGYAVDNDFAFNSYVAHNLEEEKKIVRNFTNFINKIQGDYVTIVHWSDIEKRLFNEVLSSYKIKINKKIIWFDLYNYFKNSQVYVKGSLNYKLKSICRSLYDNGLIKSKWENSFADGLGAMTGYLTYLESRDEEIIKEIVSYNEIDCKVLWEIYTLLKKQITYPI